MTDIERLTAAVSEQGKQLAEVAGDVKAIVQWTRDRRPICDQHGADIRDLYEKVGEQKDRVTAGLTTRSLIAGLIAALASALAVGIPLYLMVSRALAAAGKAGG